MRTLQAGGMGTRRAASTAGEQFAPLIADLVSRANEPLCIVDGNFCLRYATEALYTMTEFRGARDGVSIFESGLTPIQSKQLVHTITEARRDTTARSRIAFQRGGEMREHEVTVTSFVSPDRKSPLFGIMFTSPAAK